LLPRPLEVLGGEIRFEDRNITDLDERAMQSVRGGGVAMVYQDPMTSLNPLLRVRTQLIGRMAPARLRHGRAPRKFSDRWASWIPTGSRRPSRTSCPGAWSSG
jgi:ABC-type dipeptide/oligopeptide/nickel transport system ATPase component